MTTTASSRARVHVILVPGFAGFDALGQLEYYANVTPLFRRWQADVAPAARIVLHYFDNLPTASVATRARMLRRYLAKRWARGEMQSDDFLALVGHSTGGLDIRRFLVDLEDESRRARAQILVDGACETATRVSPATLLGMVKRVVFLSVPQWGTNIADWVRSHPLQRRVLTAELRALVGAARVTPLNDLEELAAGYAANVSGADLFLAVRDSVSEVDAGAGGGDPERTADAHGAAADLQLWLTHMASDFGVIDDLAATPATASGSPAHFGPRQREAERRLWKQWGIQTRSYATLGTRPYDFAPGEVVPAWEILKPSTSPWSRLVDGARARMDDPYLCGYRACAGGPFRIPDAGGAPVATLLGTSERRSVETWDNDGIVNTASMLWPDGQETQLVDADHGDIIGHYRLLEAEDGGPRRYHTYDLLRSDSRFTSATFAEVWRGVFAFCGSAGAGPASEAAHPSR